MNPHPPLRQHGQQGQQAGFTLLEVLIAVVVLSIGLLGLAALQALSLRSNSQSYERSQATALAYEIADVMRANRVAAVQGAFVLVANELPAAAADCEAAPCSQADMAAYALAGWHQRLRTALPGGTARIACPACAAGVVQTVSVMWDEARNGARSTDCPPASSFNEKVHMACVQVSLIP